MATWEEFLSGLKAWFKACFAAKPATLLTTLLMVLVVLAGLAFRARGYLVDASAFWLDECQWAMNLTTRDVL